MNEAKWRECIAFHGHACPDLAIGYRASEIAEDFFGRRLPSTRCAYRKGRRSAWIASRITTEAGRCRYRAQGSVGSRASFIEERKRA